MRAMGLDDEAIAKPMIGVVSMKGEQTTCNMTHGFQIEAAKQGIAEAGGTPREFTTISMSDGIGMNHEGMKFSLVSRELIADSIEAVVHVVAYDGLIGFGGCDKTLPGVMMGMLRCNVPSAFIYGGSELPGRFAGRDVTILDSYWAIGAVMTGGMDEATLARLERSCLATVGACAGQFTANTMAMVSEALGLSVPNVSMIPGVYVERANHARRTGAIVMAALVRGGPRPRDIDDVDAVSRRTPLIADLRPSGRFTAKDVHDIGGTAVILRALLDGGYLDGSCLTATGATIAETYGSAATPDRAVVRPTAAPLAPDGGLAVLKGNLCPDGALIKVAGLAALARLVDVGPFEDRDMVG
jgi:dihydroxy-acid dehydratase